MRKYSNVEVLGKIIDVLDTRFDGAWHLIDFEPLEYSSFESSVSIKEIAELLRQYDQL
jgi:hypothetical protein